VREGASPQSTLGHSSPQPNQSPARDRLACLALSALLVAGLHVAQARIAFDLADEGFLWYGSQQTERGQVPFRDFQSYDPGRYYWNAACSLVLGDGILAHRQALALFQLVGLSAGLYTLRRARLHWGLVVAAGICLLLWMLPRHKVFDSGFAMIVTLAGTWLVRSPSLRGHFQAGALVGLAACFGLNHAVYGTVAHLALILFALARLDPARPARRLAAWFLGACAGYLPIAALALLVPGYAAAQLDNLAAIASSGTTNLEIPVPWPWRSPASPLPLAGRWHAFGVGAAFLLAPLAAGLLALRLWKSAPIRTADPACLAGLFTGTMYLHHAFSRADVGHLAQSIHPLLIALWAALPAATSWRSAWRTAAILAPLAACTLLAAGIAQPLGLKLLAGPGVYVPVQVGDDTLLVHEGVAGTVEQLNSLRGQIDAEGGRIGLVSRWPALYSVWRERSPLWDLYYLLPGPPAREERAIRQLEEERVEWVIADARPLDGRPDLRIETTHPRLWHHLTTAYEPRPDLEPLPGFTVFHRRPDVASRP
jgi:hypothetical protein